MAEGSAARVFCDTLEDLKKAIEGCTSNQALAIGRLKDGLPSPVQIVCKGKLSKHPGAISRSLDHFELADGPSACLLDIDLKGAPAGLDPIAALTQVLPDLDFIAYVERASTSSGISDGSPPIPDQPGVISTCWSKISATFPASFVPFKTVCGSPASVGATSHPSVGSGAICDRYAVGSPERLCFEGPPRLGPRLVQAPRPAIVRNPGGKALDTKAACPNLSKEDAAKVAKLKKAELRLLPERKLKREEWSAPRTDALVKSGVDEKEARARVARAIDDCKLYGEFILPSMASLATFLSAKSCQILKNMLARRWQTRTKVRAMARERPACIGRKTAHSSSTASRMAAGNISCCQQRAERARSN